MTHQSRETLLEQAEKLFSRKGFYGTSINEVAAASNLTKQGLLHHFPSKEKLYGAVLQRCAERLMALVDKAMTGTTSPTEQLAKLFRTMNCADEEMLRVVLLLLRELLDNRERAESSHKWFMGPFLDALVGMVERAQQQGALTGYHPLAFVYQLLGATQYYLVSQPTLKQLYSQQEFETHERQHLALMERQIIGTG